MNVQQLIDDAREAVTSTGRRVYSEPYEKNGLTVIPAASVRGGAGGGGGESKEGEEGGGGGFGVTARPVGAWVVREGKVTWKPAIDVNRIILGFQIVAIVGIFFGTLTQRRWARALQYAPPEWRKSKRHGKARFSR